jgi:hypothetical protein
LLLGPTTVGWLSTNLYGEARLGWAIGTTTAVYGLIPMLILPILWRAYHRKLAVT